MALIDPAQLNDTTTTRFLKFPGVTAIDRNTQYIGDKAPNGDTLTVIEVMDNMQLPFLAQRFFDIIFTPEDVTIDITAVCDAKYRLKGEPGTVNLPDTLSQVNASGPYDGCVLSFYTDVTNMQVAYGDTVDVLEVGNVYKYIAVASSENVGSVTWYPYYRINHAVAGDTPYGKGTSTKFGHVALSDSLESDSDVTGGTAATPLAVKLVKSEVRPVSTGGTGVSQIGTNRVIVGTGSEAMRVTGVTIDENNYIVAANVQTPSLRALKQDIVALPFDPVKLIEDTDIYEFKYKKDVQAGLDRPRIGFIADDTADILSDKKTAFDLSNCVGVLLAAVKQLSERVKQLEGK